MAKSHRRERCGKSASAMGWDYLNAILLRVLYVFNGLSLQTVSESNYTGMAEACLGPKKVFEGYSENAQADLLIRPLQ